MKTMVMAIANFYYEKYRSYYKNFLRRDKATAGLSDDGNNNNNNNKKILEH